jgi:2-polyprenyl-6-methoxyphenol hydroxylase-like FAD-dependent oxidoreductase
MSIGTSASPRVIQTRCCIAGGGPAGMMLGFLLARAGVDIVVLEKHADFLRDFRGDTIHPSTLEVMHELGLLAEFLKRPHQEATELTGIIGETEVKVADFTHLPTHCKFIAFMPQWDFLNFLVEQGRRFPPFHVQMQAEVRELIREPPGTVPFFGVLGEKGDCPHLRERFSDGERIVGVRAATPDGPLEVRAELIVGADGRQSTIRRQAGLEVQDLGAPIDVLWLRISRRPADRRNPLGRFDRGRVFIMLDRGDYWQCAYVIHKGGFDDVRQRGIEALRADIAAIAPFFADRLDELRDWNDVHLLTVAVDRLRQWCRPGLLCIGDAAHAMSPVGGVGINLAIQDAVAAANILAEPLREQRVALADLQKIQHRREMPTRWTQSFQIFVHERVLTRVLGSQQQITPPWPMRLLGHWPALRRLSARLVGIGLRPEHVKTPDAFADRTSGILNTNQR